MRLDCVCALQFSYSPAEIGNLRRSFRRVKRCFPQVGAPEHSGKRIIIGGRNRIEFVVVTARTRNGQTQKGLPGNIDLVVDIIGSRFLRVGRAVQHFVEPELRGTERRLPSRSIFAQALRRELVARNVLSYELVVRNIFVECANHIVAIAPRIELVVIVLVSVRLGIADKVEPVPGPALAVVG